ncbi:MAG: hypothetical protein ACRC42_00410 [Mycoplasma sp.]
MKKIIMTLSILLSACSSIKPLRPFGQSSIMIIHNGTRNVTIGDTIIVRDLGDVDILLHEFGHIMSFNVKRPNEQLIELLNKEYPIPPKIIPSEHNKELQDFITTSTRWKIKYPFKHNKNCNIIEELMANLFAIFVRRGEELEYIKNNYNEIYIEYEKYYHSLKR